MMNRSVSYHFPLAASETRKNPDLLYSRILMRKVYPQSVVQFAGGS